MIQLFILTTIIIISIIIVATLFTKPTLGALKDTLTINVLLGSIISSFVLSYITLFHLSDGLAYAIFRSLLIIISGCFLFSFVNEDSPEKDKRRAKRIIFLIAALFFSTAQVLVDQEEIKTYLTLKEASGNGNERQAKLASAYIKRGTRAVSVELILDDGLDPNSEDPDSGRSLLCLTIEANNLEIAKLLIDYGADPFKKDSTGYSPIDLATAQNKKVFLELFKHEKTGTPAP